MSKTFIQTIRERLNRRYCNTVLDLGCGHCAVSREYKNNFFMTGIDLDDKEVELAKKYYSNAIKLDIKEALNTFGESSFDTVISLDVLEHLNKEDSIKVLEDAEKIAIKFVAHFTPKGAISTFKRIVQPGEDSKGLMAHRCEWTEQELKDRGYEVEYFGTPFDHYLAIKEIK